MFATGVLCLAGCNDGSGDPKAQTGANPTLPDIQQYLLPPMHIARIVGWKKDETPAVAQGLQAKAFGGGADFVMLGGMLAGHDECGSDIVEINGVKKMRFYGMSSREAMNKYSGGVAAHRAAEGKEVLLDCRGPVEATVQEILGGVRSACTYVGASQLKELTKRGICAMPQNSACARKPSRHLSSGKALEVKSTRSAARCFQLRSNR